MGSRVRAGIALALTLAVLSGTWSSPALATDPPSADLAISVGEWHIGSGEVEWEVVVSNNGPDTAVAVMLDTKSLGDMPAGTSAFFTFYGDCGGYLTVTSSTDDPDLSNNRAKYGQTCEECTIDPLVLEVPADFVVTGGEPVAVDAIARGSDTGTCDTPAPPYWTQTAGPAVLPQDPHYAEDLSFTAPSGPTTLTFVLNYDGQTRTLNITVLDSTPSFDRFLSPLPASPVRKSGASISVKFLLTDSVGNPVTSTGGILTARLTPGTTSAPCAWSATAEAFQCNLKPPKGLGSDNPYTVSVLYDKAPLPGASTSIWFKR